jgi:hypothetical protein
MTTFPTKQMWTMRLWDRKSGTPCGNFPVRDIFQEQEQDIGFDSGKLASSYSRWIIVFSSGLEWTVDRLEGDTQQMYFQTDEYNGMIVPVEASDQSWT